MPDDALGVLDRVAAILEVLGNEDRGLGISELAARAGLPKSTVSRLVSGLVRQHYLERDGPTVRLGLRLFELGQLAPSPRSLRQAAMPVMAELRRATGATVALDVRDGDDLVRIALVRGWPAPLSTPRLGARESVVASLAGRSSLTGATMIEREDAAADGDPHLFGCATPLFLSDGIDAVLSLVSGDAATDAESTRSALMTAASRIVQDFAAAQSGPVAGAAAGPDPRGSV